MMQIKDSLALQVFDTIARLKGYRFRRVKSKKEYRDIDNVYGEEGFSFPSELQKKVKAYKAGTINFVAYYKNTPVGTVRLADPNVINRPYELYGVDMEGEHYEIQNLLVSKGHRDGSQFVMLGLFRAMYEYSVSHGIKSWSSCGTRSVYLTMRKFCRQIETADIDFAAIQHPLTQYLFTNRIIDTYFTMEVCFFEPWTILKRCIRQLSKKWQLPQVFHLKKHIYAGINYGGK